jgi:probable HAF family extracellular repeat protein
MKQRCLSSVTLGLLLCATSIAISAEIRYRITPVIGDPPTVSLGPQRMNNKGELVGSSQAGPFLWHHGETVNLGAFFDPSLQAISAEGINNRSDVIGFYVSEGAFRGFLLRRDEVIGVEALAGEAHVFLQDLNNRGQIIGTTEDASFQSRAFVWQRGEVMLLDPLPGGSRAGARRINDRGVVVGGSESADGSRAVIWRQGEVINLGVLPGALGSAGLDINNRGQVVGILQFPVDEGEPGDVRVFLWERGVMSELPSLTGALESTPFSINNAGDIVGRSEFRDPSPDGPVGRVVATMWDNGVAVALDDLIRSDDPLRPFVTLVLALVINDPGQILVLGFDSRTPSFLRPYLLSPSH